MPLRDSFPQLSMDPDSPVAKHLQLAALMEDLIRSGRAEPNERLPSENELCEGLSLSRSTVRKALSSLERKRILYRKQGQGTFVADPGAAMRPESAAGGITGSARAARPAGADEGGRRKARSPIGLLLPSMSNEIYPLIVRGVEDVAEAHGWSVFIGNTYADRDRESALLEQMLEREVDGLIIEPTQAGFDKPGTRNFQLLAEWGRPCVLLDNDIPGLDFSRVMIDDVAGGRAAAEHLISRGHRRIAYVYKGSVLAAVDRGEGCAAAMRAAGIEPDPSLFIAYSEEEEARVPGYAFTLDLLRRPDRPSAIFYFNDELAFQGIRAIRELGLAYPRDVSIIGFDNVKSAASSDVRLSSIEHPKYFAGRWAADILFDHMERGESRIRRRITVLPEIVDRGSVAAPFRA